MSAPTDVQLHAYAAGHITHEVTALVDQVTYLRDNAAARPVQIALIEAGLLHVRVLDDFFRMPAESTPRKCPSCEVELPAREQDDIVAQHYLSSWPAKGVLKAAEWRSVNAHLAHLALRRVDGDPWELGGFMVRVCDRFAAFVDMLSVADIERAAWFAEPYEKALEMVCPPGRLRSESMPTYTTSNTAVFESRRGTPDGHG